ncbi:MAG: four helix bundle protein [Candidatus Pacebacteria bacterium]|nr:four helix bundle protein [Candidatus Paceibacterota bacterium]
MQIEKFTDLKTWQEAHSVVIDIYKITKKFPKEELFGLTNQMRRSAVSITSNIAEGFGRNTLKDKARFFYIARGSMVELRNQLIISKDIQYISETEYVTFENKIDNAQRLLHGLIRKTNAIASLKSSVY